MSLGDLSYLTLLVVARLRDEAWSGGIREELLEVTGRDVTVGTVFVTLTRLEDRGLLSSTRGDRPERGGRARRVFAVTEAGWAALHEARAAAERLWEELEQGGVG